MSALLAVVVVTAALKGCAPDVGARSAVQIGIARGGGGEVVAVVPPCAGKVTAIELFLLTGVSPLWSATSKRPHKVEIAVVGAPLDGFKTPQSQLRLPIESTRLRLKVTFASTTAGGGRPKTTTTTTSTTAPGTAHIAVPKGVSTSAPRPTTTTSPDDVLSSSEVNFRLSDLETSKILLNGDQIASKQFTDLACKKSTAN